MHEGTTYVSRSSATKPIDADSWEELLERYYEKACKLRRIDAGKKEAKELFDLDRKTFLERAFRELGR